MPEPDSDPDLLAGDEEREMLRRSLREFLQRYWRAPYDVPDLWLGLGNLGVTSLGAEPSEGGLREILIVAEELGRAACGAPFLGGALVNLCLRRMPEAARCLNRIHGGETRVALAFGRLDANPGAGAARWNVGAVNGSLRFVDGAQAATHLCVVLTEPSGLTLVDLGQTSVAVAPTRALGGDGLCDVMLNDAAAGFVALEPARLRDLRDLAALGLLARAHGAARRSFEMAVDYAKERKQFGQPIGRFPAIQHKLANGLIALEGVRLTLGHAARAFDLGESSWRYFAAAAIAFGGGALRQTSLETHHAFGAIGYAEDHEAPRHFKRVHVDCLALGGAAGAREDLAAHLLDIAEAVLPEYDLGSEGNAFRLKVRGWLKQNWSGERKAAFDRRPFERREFDPSFACDLGETGWIGLGWPVEFGGQARTPLEQLAFIEEMERAEAPRIGAAVQASALMMFGTREQQERYLPEILRGEAMHGMGYSEPGAGSDLAAFKDATRRASAVASGHP